MKKQSKKNTVAAKVAQAFKDAKITKVGVEDIYTLVMQGGFVRTGNKLGWQKRIVNNAKKVGLEAVAGNDAPKGGKVGNFVRLDRGDNVVAFNTSLLMASIIRRARNIANIRRLRKKEEERQAVQHAMYAILTVIDKHEERLINIITGSQGQEKSEMLAKEVTDMLNEADYLYAGSFWELVRVVVAHVKRQIPARLGA